MSILMLHPVFKDAIWGGKLLKNFGYEEAGDNAGECWGISAHQNGDCTVANGEFAGKKLSWCYENHRELFGNIKQDVFSLLIKNPVKTITKLVIIPCPKTNAKVAFKYCIINGIINNVTSKKSTRKTHTVLIFNWTHLKVKFFLKTSLFVSTIFSFCVNSKLFFVLSTFLSNLAIFIFSFLLTF